jgi:hypothetical protein
MDMAEHVSGTFACDNLAARACTGTGLDCETGPILRQSRCVLRASLNHIHTAREKNPGGTTLNGE